MNSLFVRIWLTLWLALILVVLVSVGLFGYLRSLEESQMRIAPPELFLQNLSDDLAEAISEGKTPQFWLRQVSTNDVSIYLINSTGEDLLGREVPRYLTREAVGENRRATRARLTLTVEVPELGDMTLLATRRGSRSPLRWFSTEILIGLGFLLSGIGAIGLARYIAFPITKLKNATDMVARGEFDTNVAASVGLRNDEVADLAHRFDEMSSALARMQESQQNLLRDVSHELRSPLTRLRLTTELLAKQTSWSRESLVSRLQKDLELLNGLVDEVVALARFDAESGNLEPTPQDIVAGLLPVFDDAQFEANVVDKVVEFHYPDSPMMADVDIVQLRRVFENVVRNAIRHTPTGSKVRATAFHEADNIVITVEDEGTGVPEAEIGRIFTPFYRGATTRAQFTGTGIGLALVQRIVQAHRGNVSAENTSTGGLLVRIEIPAS